MPEVYVVSKGGISASMGVKNGKIVTCSLIIKWCKGLSIDSTYKWFVDNGYEIEKVNKEAV